jgi:Quinohemoprotein amine dehydrogenase, alpha subunit domain III
MEINMAENEKAEIGKITGAVEDAVTYPILTREVTLPPPSDGTSGSRPAGGSSLDSVAQNTIRQLLGWRYRADDTKGFLAALDKTFLLKEVQGHIEWDVQAQNYMVQADLGEVTGAQASIYARAKVALDQSMPLLDGLALLGAPKYDVEDMEATRALIRTEFTTAVSELGIVGGPRVQRVDSLFALLLGPNPPNDPTQAGGLLGELALRFGLSRTNVNTIDDEQDYTNFLILYDYMYSLFQTWIYQKRYFTGIGAAEPYLGTQLVLVSQALDALEESVQEVYDAMDSVFFGASDRQATELHFFNQSALITVAELFGWLEDFAKNEGLQLVQEAGKDGVVAFRSTINQLEYLIFLAMKESRAHSRNPVHGFHTARVQRGLENVAKYLQVTEREADKIQRSPSAPLRIKAVGPSSGSEWSYVFLTAYGENIQQGANMWLISAENPKFGIIPDPNSVNVSLASPPSGVVASSPGGVLTTIQATFYLGGPELKLGKYTLVVNNPDGQYAWLDDKFEITVSTSPPSAPAPSMGGPPTPGAYPRRVVTPPPPPSAGPTAGSSTVGAAATPILKAMSPKTVKRGETRWVTINGENFAPGATIDFGADIQVLTAGFVNSTEYVVRIKVQAGASTEPRDVTFNIQGLSGALSNGFQVK